MKKIKSIIDVVEYQLCTGCGMCAYIEPLRFEMLDSLEYGKRPFLIEKCVDETGEALAVCPGIHLKRENNIDNDENIISELSDGWGNVYSVWEGYAADEEIRLSGSSGGASTVLALYCLEKGIANGVIHTSADENIPYINKTVLSKNRHDLLKSVGSRYSPASPAEGLKFVADKAEKYVFVGKPCDIAAVHNAKKIRPELDKHIPIRIGFFCAGVPSLEGNINLLKNNGVNDLSSLKSLNYRGNGWPGLWRASFFDKGKCKTVTKTYSESWGYLQKFRQWRCYICPDHTGEFSDISVGDPWYRDVLPNEQGKSLIVARTKRGLELIEAAAKDGYLILESKNYKLLPGSQPNLLLTKGTVWARLLMLRLFGAPFPKYQGFVFFKYWLTQLTIKDKAQSVYGTVKRIFIKKLHSRIKIEKYK